MTNPPPLTARLKELLEKATPEWEACDPGDYGDFDGDSRIILGGGVEMPIRVAVFHWHDNDDWREENDANIELAVEARNSLPTLLSHIASLEAEVERLRKRTAPQWFYAEGWEEHCFHSPDEVIDFLDLESGQHVIEITTATPCPSIWCAVSITDDDDADERFTFSEHDSEEEARAAIQPKEGREDG